MNDAGLNNITELLKVKSFFSKNVSEGILKKQSSFPSIDTVLENQKNIEQLKSIKDTSKIDTVLEEIINLEKKLEFFYEKDNSLESLEEDTFGQLIFQQEDFKIFNTIPFLLLILSYMKIYFVPLISIMLPIVMYFLPYLLIKYVWRMPMSYEMYQKIMGQMISFSFDGSIEKLAQNAFTVFTFAQSMYQPIQNAMHLSTINSTIYDLGKYLYDYTNSINQLKSILESYNVSFKINNYLEYFCDNLDFRKNFSIILNNPTYLYLVSYSFSKFELLYSIAKNPRFNKVTLYNSESPFLSIKNCVDINLNEEKCVGSDFIIDVSSNHFLLSGPNGGGKSSFLRAIFQTILFSQAFGYAIGDSIQLSMFDYIFSGLKIVDIPGEKSLFQKEVSFASDILYFNNPKLKGLVLFDEIFHSTNPPDGIRTAEKFLTKLYTYKHMASIVSTHVFEIIDSAPEFIKRVCIDASIEDNKLVYNYKLKDGICKVSSVSEIWDA